MPVAEDRFPTHIPVHGTDLEGPLRVELTRFVRPFGNDRCLRKAEGCAQRVRIRDRRGLVGDACAGMVGGMIGEWLLPRFYFLFVEALAVNATSLQSCYRFFCARLAPADGARVGNGDYTSRKGSSAASPPDCDVVSFLKGREGARRGPSCRHPACKSYPRVSARRPGRRRPD